MAKKLSITNGFTALSVPSDVKVTAVMYEGKRIPYRLTAERKIQTREPVSGIIEVSFAKEQPFMAVPVEAAAYIPFPASK